MQFFPVPRSQEFSESVEFAGFFMHSHFAKNAFRRKDYICETVL